MRVVLLAFACFDLGDGGLDQPDTLGVSEQGQPGLPLGQGRRSWRGRRAFEAAPLRRWGRKNGKFPKIERGGPGAVADAIGGNLAAVASTNKCLAQSN